MYITLLDGICASETKVKKLIASFNLMVEQHREDWFCWLLAIEG